MPDHKIVFEGERFLISDISALLPRHPRYPFCSTVKRPDGKRSVSGRYFDVPGRRIEKLFFHQTAGSYAPGFSGVMNTGRFFVTDPKYSASGMWQGNGRGWPGFAYTWYVCFEPELLDGKSVVYQCNSLDTVSWHTARHNRTGAGIAFQGYFRSRHIRRFVPFSGTDGEPSDVQMMLAEAFLDEYAIPAFGLDAEKISGHFAVGKKTCPGDTLERFVLERQGRLEPSGPGEEAAPPQDLFRLDDWKLRQAALVALGHDLGPFGPKKNGVDGKPGNMTRMAIEAEEALMGQKPKGVFDGDFERMLIERLVEKGVTREEIDELV